jgi:hypothetical protein
MKKSSLNKQDALMTASGVFGFSLIKLLNLIKPKYLKQRTKPIKGGSLEEKSVKTRPWRLFQVESAIACNLKCVMCPWREIAKKAEDRGIMIPAVWQAIRPLRKKN